MKEACPYCSQANLIFDSNRLSFLRYSRPYAQDEESQEIQLLQEQLRQKDEQILQLHCTIDSLREQTSLIDSYQMQLQELQQKCENQAKELEFYKTPRKPVDFVVPERYRIA